MQSYVIYMIRHGAIDETLKGRYIGRTDVNLSEKGKENLRDIKEKFGYPVCSKVYASPLARCTQTCEIIYPDRDIDTVPALSECDFGEWEGKSAVELSGKPEFTQWLQNLDKASPPKGETGKEFAIRICRGFEKIVNEVINGNILQSAVVTHGGIIMTLLSVYGIPQAESYKWQMDNGYGFALRVTPSLWFRDKIVEVFDTVPFAPKAAVQTPEIEFFE